MTAATLDGLSLQEQCEAILAATEAEERRLAQMKATPPGLFVFDGHQRLQHLLLEVVSLHAEDPENDTGLVELTLPFDHPVAQWMNDDKGRIARGEGEFFHIDVEHNGVRITARYDSKTVRTDARGQRLLYVRLLTDYENLKWIDCWSNPFLPAIFQFPRLFILAGPAIWALKTALFLNLLRINSSIWQIPDDPMKPITWLDGLDMSTWDVVVKPTTLLEDLAAGTTWCLFTSRWGKWHDRAQAILADAELSVVTRRWRAGDPLPWPGADIKDGALVVDIVDKSGQLEGAVNGGTYFDGFTRTAREYVGDMMEDVEVEVFGQPDGYSAMWDDMFGAPVEFPLVHFPADSLGHELEYTTTPSKGITINAGGQSAPGVNEGISAGVQATVDLITSNLNVSGYGVGAMGGAVDAVLKPFYTDVVAAWISAKLPHRIAQSGSSHYKEYHLDLPGKAYTLSSMLAVRTGIVATQRKKSWSAKLALSPYVVGWPGSGHFYKGARASMDVPGDTSEQMHVQRAQKMTLDWAFDHFAAWEAEFGHSPDTDALSEIIGKISEVTTAASELGVW